MLHSVALVFSLFSKLFKLFGLYAYVKHLGSTGTERVGGAGSAAVDRMMLSVPTEAELFHSSCFSS